MPKVGKDLLSDFEIKNAKHKDKAYSLRDGNGLWLVVEPNGKKKKWWKLRTVFIGKNNSFSLGTYPEVALSNAREQRNEIRKQLVAGVDPAVFRKVEKARHSGKNTFETFACDWHEKFKNTWSVNHAVDVMNRLKKYVFPYLGKRPLDAITTPEIDAVLQRIAPYIPEAARRTMTTCSMIFRQAVRIGRIPYNPVESLRGSLPPVKAKHMAAPTDPKEAARLLRVLDGYSGTFVVVCALRLAPLVFVRPGELREAEWADIDLEKAEWRYAITKTNTNHIVPLSRQAIAILREVYSLTGFDRYVFPSAHSTTRPMSKTTVNKAMRRMGIDTKNELTFHGFRAMARTILDEVLNLRPELLEHQLGHTVRDPLGRAYNRTSYLPERKTMMQAWADYLDKIKADV